eukprot:gene23308-28206_t
MSGDICATLLTWGIFGNRMTEWIEFHLHQGVSKFIVYVDVRSSGGTAYGVDGSIGDILLPYTLKGIVELVEWPVDATKVSHQQQMVFLDDQDSADYYQQLS